MGRCWAKRGTLKEHELRLAGALLADLDLHGVTVTGDAQFCQRALSHQVVAAGGAYFWAVKTSTAPGSVGGAVYPGAPTRDVARAVQRGRHGDRQEERTLRTSTLLNDYLDWPHVAQVCTIERVVTRHRRTTREAGYALTSLHPDQADATSLAALWRGHWGIENCLHWVRDVTFDEDRSQIRTGHAPQVVAALRNTAIGILRRAGHTNSRRHCAPMPQGRSTSWRSPDSRDNEKTLL